MVVIPKAYQAQNSKVKADMPSKGTTKIVQISPMSPKIGPPIPLIDTVTYKNRYVENPEYKWKILSVSKYLQKQKSLLEEN